MLVPAAWATSKNGLMAQRGSDLGPSLTRTGSNSRCTRLRGMRLHRSTVRAVPGPVAYLVTLHAVSRILTERRWRLRAHTTGSTNIRRFGQHTACNSKFADRWWCGDEMKISQASRWPDAVSSRLGSARHHCGWLIFLGHSGTLFWSSIHPGCAGTITQISTYILLGTQCCTPYSVCTVKATADTLFRLNSIAAITSPF